MTRNGWWVLGGALLALVVLAGGWFIGISPALAAADDASQNAANTQSQNDAMRLKLAALSRAAAKQGEMETKDAVLQKAVPSILKPNTFSRRVYEVAALQGVQVDSWALGEAIAYTVPASLTSASAPAAATPAASPSPSATASAAPVSAASSTVPVLAKSDPLITSANFTAVPATITVIGSQDAVLRFASAIQDDERVMLVNGLTTQKNDDGTTSGGLTGYIYTVKR